MFSSILLLASVVYYAGLPFNEVLTSSQGGVQYVEYGNANPTLPDNGLFLYAGMGGPYPVVAPNPPAPPNPPLYAPVSWPAVDAPPSTSSYGYHHPYPPPPPVINPTGGGDVPEPSSYLFALAGIAVFLIGMPKFKRNRYEKSTVVVDRRSGDR